MVPVERQAQEQGLMNTKCSADDIHNARSCLLAFQRTGSREKKYSYMEVANEFKCAGTSTVSYRTLL